MLVEPLAIPDVKRLVPHVHRDARGQFSETYSQRALDAAGLSLVFVQDNHSVSNAQGVVRGLHFQTHPHAQGKLVRVTRGAVFDVAVDIRQGSPTYYLIRSEIATGGRSPINRSAMAWGKRTDVHADWFVIDFQRSARWSRRHARLSRDAGACAGAKARARRTMRRKCREGPAGRLQKGRRDRARQPAIAAGYPE
jgi:hypothetical protein